MEIMVVIVILGILIVGGYVFGSSYLQSSRDNQRKLGLHAIEGALNAFYQDQ